MGQMWNRTTECTLRIRTFTCWDSLFIAKRICSFVVFGYRIGYVLVAVSTDVRCRVFGLSLESKFFEALRGLVKLALQRHIVIQVIFNGEEGQKTLQMLLTQSGNLWRCLRNMKSQLQMMLFSGL